MYRPKASSCRLRGNSNLVTRRRFSQTRETLDGCLKQQYKHSDLMTGLYKSQPARLIFVIFLARMTEKEKRHHVNTAPPGCTRP